MKEKLKEIFLLGVDRKPFDIEALPDAIIPYIKQSENDAQKALMAMSFLTYYNTNGKPLRKSAILQTQNRIEESMPYLDHKYCMALRAIFELSNFLKPRMFKSWLDAIADKNYAVMPNFILEVVREGKAVNANYKAIIKKVIGNRGEAILPLMDAKEYISIKAVSVWDEGGSEDRKNYFRELRIEKIEDSIATLQSTWTQESIKDKIEFAKIIQDSLHTTDIVFLEVVYIALENKALKKTEKQLKTIVISCLVALKYEPIINNLQQLLSPYVTSKKRGVIASLLSSNSEINISLPQNNDSFWVGKNMENLMAFEDKNINIKLYDYDSYFWFACFVEVLPISFWSDMLDVTEEDFIKHLLANFKTKYNGKEQSVFLEAIIKNQYIASSQKTMEILFPICSAYELYDLVPIMTQPTFEKYIMVNKELSNYDLLAHRKEEQIWSVTFTKNVVSEAFRNLKGNQNITERQGSILAAFANPEAYDHIREMSQSFVSEYWFHQWNNHVLVIIEKLTTIRQIITQIKNL